MVKQCIIITGMHRSGTSLGAGMIHKMGVDMGTPLQANKFNQLGFLRINL